MNLYDHILVFLSSLPSPATKIILFIVIFNVVNYGLKFSELNTKWKSARWVAGSFASLTIFSPQYTFDNNAAFIFFFPIFYATGFAIGVVYRTFFPHKQKEKQNTEVNKENNPEVEYYVMSKGAAIFWLILILGSISIIIILS